MGSTACRWATRAVPPGARPQGGCEALSRHQRAAQAVCVLGQEPWEVPNTMQLALVPHIASLVQTCAQ